MMRSALRSVRPMASLVRPAATRSFAATSRLVTPTTAITARRTFLTSSVLRSQGQSDRDLTHKLESELKFEVENNEPGVPAFVKAFNEKGLFKIEDKVGEKEVTLVRNFGNEKISVIFSTDSLTEQQEFDDADEDDNPSIPISLTVLVEKRTPTEDSGALDLAVTLQDQSFFIDTVSFSPSSALISDQTAEGDWQRRGQYGGPVFQDLDEGLQDQFHSFLTERGFDAALAEFIPAYVEYKEQNEYAEWLKRVAQWVAK
ncbi:Mitochondrial acidic protein mam33 [Blyttiomyces sp. JEL0837]|nr:Mitochondrial acidic protein mam33 [Blyttiomyces sp. JEL0837]